MSDDWLKLLLEIDVLFGNVNESLLPMAGVVAADVGVGGGTCVFIAFVDEILEAVRRNSGGVSRVALVPMYVMCGMSDDRIVGECFALTCE